MPNREEPQSNVERTLENIERTMAANTVRLDQLDQRIASLTAAVEANTQAVGHFYEGMTELRNLVTDGFAELRTITQQQAENARLQAESVRELVGLVRELATK